MAIEESGVAFYEHRRSSLAKLSRVPRSLIVQAFIACVALSAAPVPLPDVAIP